MPPPEIPALGTLTGLDASLRRDAEAAHRRLAAAPDDVSRWIALGRVMDRCELPAISERVWAGASALDPTKSDWPYFAGVAAIGAFAPPRARGWFETCLSLDDGNSYAWRQLGSLAIDDGDLPAARAAFERVKDLSPESHDGHTGLALVALNVGDSGAAVDHAQDALGRAPNDLYQRHLLGAALRANGEGERAEPHLLAGEGASVQWATLSSANHVALMTEPELMARGDQLASEAKLEEAAAIYRRVLILRPDDGRVRGRLATALTVMGRVDEGLVLLDESLARTPDNYHVLMSKADVLRIAKRLPASRATLMRAIDAWPQRADAWIQLGALEREAGRPDDARRAFEQGYSLEPTNPTAIAQLAQHMARAGRVADAATLLEGSMGRVDAPPHELLAYMLQIQERAGRSKAVLDATRERIRRLGGAPTTPSR